MMNPSRRTAAVPLFAAIVLAACGAATTASPPSTVQPGAPGEATRPVSPAAGATSAPAHTEADERFMRDMLVHHAQALEMAALVPSRTTSEDIRLLAERIEVSQNDEIAAMRSWLRSHGDEEPAAGEHAHHGAGGEHAGMPGMLTEAELARLAAASGAEFDRLFLEFMIRHHQGALVMVEELFSTPGSGQAGDIFQIASEIASDQRMEIDRMRALLASL